MKEELREYQLEAIRAWELADYRGIWSMATGTGKTITALSAISSRIRAKGSVVIVVPTRDLVDQWAVVLEHQNLAASTVRCYSERRGWRVAAAKAILQRHLQVHERRPAYLIATASTAISKDFGRVLRLIPPDELLIVGDEVHRLGANSWRRVLSMPAQLGRLGLSATPSRQWDPAGTQAIARYFGGIVFEYALQDALSDGWLCPYDYHLRLVGMEAEERAAYRDLSNKISTLLLSLSGYYGLETPDLQEVLRLAREDGNPQLELLLYARADLVKGAEGKSQVLRQLAKDSSISSCMVYCNDEPQVEKALAVLAAEGRTAVGFTSARLVGGERPSALRDFGSGVYDFIVAIRCLDEGIDIPDTRKALIMASSKTEREWIQRRGRLLRRAPGKDNATIYDCIVIPSRLDDDANIVERISPIEVAITNGELARAREFARSALNAPEAILQIEKIRQAVLRSLA